MPPRKRASEGKRAASESEPREGQFIQPVKPSTAKSSPLRRDSRPRHAAAEDTDPAPKTPRKRTAAKSAPKSAPPAPKSAPPTRVGDGGAAARRERRTAAIHQEGREYANRAAYRATHGKPSVVGRSAAGAAAGAAVGTVGGPAGTAVGAVLGGAGGAVGGAKAKREYKHATRTSAGARRIIVTEFAICIVIAALSPMTDPARAEKPTAWMKRITAIMGVFFVLGLISAGGAGAAKAAAGFGGVVTVALAVSERNLFVKLAAVFAPKEEQGGRIAQPYTPPRTPVRYVGP